MSQIKSSSGGTLAPCAAAIAAKTAESAAGFLYQGKAAMNVKNLRLFQRWEMIAGK